MSTNFKAIFLTLIISVAFMLTSCSSTTKKAENEGDETITSVADTAQDQDFEVNADSDSGKTGAIQTIFFAFNSSQLSERARNTLKDNAAFLKANPQIEIQIEGHADERGGVQFNLALGEQRSAAVKKYLVALGIDGNRISTISFGKERPVAFGHDEESWSKNRRGNFVISAIAK